jgi:hypothetical protein
MENKIHRVAELASNRCIRSSIRKKYLVLCSCLLLLAGCKGSSKPETATEGDVPLVSVSGEILYSSDVEAMIPKGLSKNDSLLTVQSYIRKWINERLLYAKAKQNISEKDKIEEMVEDYRKTLITYTYQQDLLKENLSNKITDNELNRFYEANKDKLSLGSNLVKGLFLKVPINAPQKDELIRWYKSTSEEAIEHIEKYSLRNAEVYEYFFDKWREFGEIAAGIPGTINDSRQFLIAHKTYETRDSTFIYLLNIKEYRLAGSVPPFEYVKPQIADLIINRRKEDFLHKFEDDIYNKALEDKVVKFFNAKK